VALAADLQAMLDLAQSRLKGIDPAARPRGLALTGKAGEYFSFSGRDGWRFLDLAGAVNICAGLTQPFPIVSPEWLAAAGPDFVLLSPYRMDYAEEEREAALERALLEFKPVRDAAGLKRTRLIALDDLLTFGPRSVPGVLYLAKALHPALFADVRAEDIHLEFLRKYFDYAPQGGHIYAME
jgi:iron complex transport system substrate-binding protein